MKKNLTHTLRLFTLAAVFAAAFTSAQVTASAQELTIAGSTRGSAFSNGSTTFGGLTFFANDFYGRTSGGVMVLAQDDKLGTITFAGTGVETAGAFNLSVYFSAPSGFSVNPIQTSGEVWGFGSYYNDPFNFAMINFSNTPTPVAFSGPYGTGVFTLQLDDLCLSGGEPCSFSDIVIGSLPRSKKLQAGLAFNRARAGRGDVMWLKTKGSSGLLDKGSLRPSRLLVPTLNALETVDLDITGRIVITVPPTGVSATGCVQGQGYYQNTAGAIPTFDGFTMDLGFRAYTAAELYQIYSQPVRTNGLISLAHQLITAKLNAGASGGNVPDEILEAIIRADLLIGDLVIPPIGAGSINPKDTGALVKTLTLYNEGKIRGVTRCR